MNIDNKSIKKIEDENREAVIRLTGISKKYNLYNNKQDRLKEALHPRRKKFHKEFYALKGINLEVKKGEILGIVGRNGSGKSTLLKIISGILTPSSGIVGTKGKIVALLELGAGFNPEFTGMENIYFYCSLLGFKKEETNKLIDEILDFSELGDFIHQPIKTYSSGMKARLGFSVSVNVNPDILILDEVLAVGDELFRRKCFAKMEQFFKGGKTILFVSHSAGEINELCTRAILLDRGSCVLEGPAKFVTMYYQKMLYAEGVKKNQVLEEIKRLNSDESVKKNFKIENKGNNDKNHDIVGSIPDMHENVLSADDRIYHRDAKPVAFYVEGFKPKSSVKHVGCDMELYDIAIKTADGRIVNHLVTGDNYSIEYCLKFAVDLKDINIGVTFKDEKGKALAGMSTRNSEKIIPRVSAGDVVKVSWDFECVFLSGIYYIDLGVNQASKTDGSQFLRYLDVLVFKMIGTNKKENFKWGFIDLKIKPCIVHENNAGYLS